MVSLVFKINDSWNITFHTANVNNSFDHFVPAHQGNFLKWTLQVLKNISAIVIKFLLSEKTLSLKVLFSPLKRNVPFVSDFFFVI